MTKASGVDITDRNIDIGDIFPTPHPFHEKYVHHFISNFENKKVNPDTTDQKKVDIIVFLSQK